MEKHLSDQTFENFQRFLTKESGLYFTKDSSSSLEQKLRERMNSCRMDSYENYFHYLSLDPKGEGETKDLIDLLTVGETYFFRNEPHFDALRNHVIPEQIEKKQERALRVWSAGCSSGEEPYSLAILLRETLPDFESWNVSILATDINRNALKAACRGLYTKRAIGQVPEPILHRYFAQEGNQYRIVDKIKDMVRFERHNLIRDPFSFDPMQHLDILFCRNVTIYFHLETLKKVIARFENCLAPEGYLFIGHAETLWHISDRFRPIEFPHTFIYQKQTDSEQKLRSESPAIPIPRLKTNMKTRLLSEDETSTDEFQADNSTDSEPSSYVSDLLAQATEFANREAYEESIHCLEQVIRQDNLCVSAYYLLGILYAKMKRFEEAIGEFRCLLYIDSELVIGYFHLANLCNQRGYRGQARREYLNGLRILEKMPDDKPIFLSDGLTAGVLRQAIHRSLEIL